MEKEELLMRLIQCTMNLPVFCWDGTEEILEAKEKQYCFFKQAQPLLTAKNMQSLFEKIKSGYLYDVKDGLGIHYLTFRFDEKVVCAGPFVLAGWNEKRAEMTLAANGLATNNMLAYKIYYCGLPLTNLKQVIQIGKGIIEALQPDEDAYVYREIQNVPEIEKDKIDIYEQESSDFEEVIERYSFENRIIAMIESGNTEEALKTVSMIYSMPKPKELSVAGMESSVGNATTLRTIFRKAAERGGVHPVVVDAIALSYGQKMYVARNPKELWANIFPMARDFTEAVRKSKYMKYSPAVNKIINYILMNIRQKISIEKMASIAGCTIAHLERRFKEETGKTLGQYIAEERCRQAAVLLEHTDDPIQEISARVGYLDSNYFVKVFKKYKNMTPTAYRNKFHK